uniref:6 kDa protein n=1 Tax=Grapevine leafroll-associated virus 3 TaxID=55951 RepID=A0A345T7L1_9CLOS|nr:6 kDa protein [Grapevine leafroll-associated virus 3]
MYSRGFFFKSRVTLPTLVGAYTWEFELPYLTDKRHISYSAPSVATFSLVSR